MIVDVKAAFDRYLTHSLTRILDRQSSILFCYYEGQSVIRNQTSHISGKPRAKCPDGTRTRDGKRTAAHNNNLHPPHMNNKQASNTEFKKKKRLLELWWLRRR